MSVALTAPAATTPEWADPLYRPVVRLAHRGVRQRFGPVEADVSVLDSPPDGIAALWRPDRAITLGIDDLCGPDELARALPSFRAYAVALGGRPATPMLTLPSRDIDRCRVAREQGFRPHAVLAVCALPRPAGLSEGSPAGVRLRSGVTADAAAVTELWLAQADYAARAGGLRRSPTVDEMIRRAVPDVLAGPGDALVAELAGRVVGVLLARPPGPAGEVAARIRATLVGYVTLAATAPAERGRGIGSALVRELHRRFVARGVEVGALHHSPYNPLAAPFWAQHGYRPLLTTFVGPS